MFRALLVVLITAFVLSAAAARSTRSSHPDREDLSPHAGKNR